MFLNSNTVLSDWSSVMWHFDPALTGETVTNPYTEGGCLLQVTISPHRRHGGRQKHNRMGFLMKSTLVQKYLGRKIRGRNVWKLLLRRSVADRIVIAQWKVSARQRTWQRLKRLKCRWYGVIKWWHRKVWPRTGIDCLPSSLRIICGLGSRVRTQLHMCDFQLTCPGRRWTKPNTTAWQPVVFKSLRHRLLLKWLRLPLSNDYESILCDFDRWPIAWL
jgi:hypothetical protein